MLRINRSDCYVYSPQNLQRIAMMAGIVANRSFHRVSSLNRFCSSCSRTVAYVLIPTWFWGLTVQTAAPRPGYGRHFPHWPTQSVFAAYHGYILILGILKNGMMLLKISPYVQQVCKGAIIILAVVFDMRKNAKKA
ncbi:MAG TPA: hypothetical protein H9832_09360 [Candidatus Agathobaculum merdavium]|nr:hypothetical protein [Candidatus Agathobaculum merdavium]